MRIVNEHYCPRRSWRDTLMVWGLALFWLFLAVGLGHFILNVWDWLEKHPEILRGEG